MSSSNKKVFLFVCLSFVGGCSFGSIDTTPKPKPQAATVQPVAKVATKKAAEPTPTGKTQVETKTVTIAKAIPDSCKQAYKILSDLEPYDSVIESSAGELQDMLDKANQRIVAKDYVAVNKSISSGIILKDKLDTAAVAKATSVISFQEHLMQCNKEMLQ